MGADGFIVDPTEPVMCVLRCHTCGYSIRDGDTPITYHHECVGPDGRLAVNVDIDNYEER